MVEKNAPKYYSVYLWVVVGLGVIFILSFSSFRTCKDFCKVHDTFRDGKKKYIKKKKTNDLIRQFSAFSLTKKTQGGLHRPLFLPQSESLAMCPQGLFLTHRDKRVQTWGTKSQSCLGAQLEGNFCFDYRLLNWPCLPFLFPSFRSKSSSALLSSA